jgi:hypothetical protein
MQHARTRRSVPVRALARLSGEAFPIDAKLFECSLQAA